MRGTYQKNKAAVIALAALAWFGVLLQLYLSLHSAIENGRGVARWPRQLFWLFHHLDQLAGLHFPHHAADRTRIIAGQILRALGCHGRGRDQHRFRGTRLSHPVAQRLESARTEPGRQRLVALRHANPLFGLLVVLLSQGRPALELSFHLGSLSHRVPDLRVGPRRNHW